MSGLRSTVMARPDTGNQAQQKPLRPNGKQKSQHASQHCQQQAFRHQLPADAAPACTKGEARGDLSLPCCCPRQLQARQIDTGDQQDQHHN